MITLYKYFNLLKNHVAYILQVFEDINFLPASCFTKLDYKGIIRISFQT
jgi:hypothetical protein